MPTALARVDASVILDAVDITEEIGRMSKLSCLNLHDLYDLLHQIVQPYVPNTILGAPPSSPCRIGYKASFHSLSPFLHGFLPENTQTWFV